MYYCEYLPRLNTVSVSIDVACESIKDIQRITCQGQSLHIVAKSFEKTLCLPHGFDLSLARVGSLLNVDGLLRLNVISPRNLDATNSLMDSLASRWSCKDLQTKTPLVKGANHFTFVCKKCNSSIIDSSVKSFKDLPSEYWYELMDFWHCHKPNNDDPSHLTYGELTPQTNDVIYIGSHYLLLRPIPTVLTQDLDSVAVCKQCGTTLGEDLNSSLKLFKWNLSLTYEHKTETYLKLTYFYQTILDKINSLALRRFLVDLPQSSQTLYFWAINVGFNVSIDGDCFDGCMKLAFHLKDTTEDSQYESLEFYGDMATDFLDSLMKLNSSMPPSLQTLMVGQQENFISIISQEPL